MSPVLAMPSTVPTGSVNEVDSIESSRVVKMRTSWSLRVDP